MTPTFREWLASRHMPVSGSLIAGTSRPLYTSLPKRAGDKVLGAGGKWSVVQ